MVTTIIALYYRRLENRPEVEGVIDGSRIVGLFLSREVMIKYLLQMHDEAEAADVIWALCVRWTDFTPEVRKKILDAAGRGVQFRMVIYQHSPAANGFFYHRVPPGDLMTAVYPKEVGNLLSALCYESV